MNGPLAFAEVGELVAGRGLQAVFQPLASLRSRSFFGYEGLVRGPLDSPLHLPAALFEAARAAGQGLALEVASAREIVCAFAARGLPGRLAVNFSAPAIERLARGQGLEALLHSGLAPERLVIELTEHERVTDVAALKRPLAELRALGVALALDDFGDGHSSLRLWAELAPEFVKIDKYFIRGIHADAARFQCVKAMLQLGETFGTRLIAEGIESAEELRIVRDLGIELGQGFLLGTPEAFPSLEPSPDALAVLDATDVAIYPEFGRVPSRSRTVGHLVVRVPEVPAAMPNNAVVDRFAQEPQLHAVPVVEDGRPVGIINRRAFMDRYAQPYYRELYGRRPCTTFMNEHPMVVDRELPVDGLAEVLTGSDQRYLADGLIVVEGGRYLGLVTGESLVRAVAEIRVEAARYANPLTFLPGNIPISEHIARLLARGAEFTACYSDLNHFKPFNDQYGYWRGDEMIKLAAATMARACDPVRDFLGHVGGDDFVILFQSADWRSRCERIVAEFNRQAPALFDEVDRLRGGIDAEDRQGRLAFFPVTTISLGAVRIRPGDHRRAEDVASAAAAAKREGKHRNAGLYEAPCRGPVAGPRLRAETLWTAEQR